MVEYKPKRLYGAIFITALVLVFSLALFLFFFIEDAKNSPFYRSEISFSVELGDQILLSEDVAEPVRPGEQVLILKNGEKKDLSFTLYFGDRLLETVAVPAGQEKHLTVSFREEGTLNLLLQMDGHDTLYLTDRSAMGAAIFQMKDGGDVVFLRKVEWESEHFTAPFRLFGSFSFQELTLETSDFGRVVLAPEDAFCATVYLEAPLCRVDWNSGFSPAFSEEENNFYVKAASLNGKQLSPGSFPIQSFSQLSRLADDNLLPRLSENATLTFLSSFTVERSLSFEGDATLEFLAPVLFSGNTLTFSSSEKVNYRVKTVQGASVDCSALIFDSPLSHLIWESAGAVPAVSTVAKQNNLHSYNNVRLHLGGEGTALPSLVLLSNGNDLLEEDVVFQVRGNTLEATLPYLVSQASLDEAAVTLTCPDGQVRLEGSLSTGIIVTTDKEGREHRFALSILREDLGIPVVYLETEKGASITSRSQYVSATFSFDGGKGGYEERPETPILIRGRGNSTWKWEKKPYKIHFQEPTSLLGLPAAEEWALFANYADKSLIRNRLAQAMASALSFRYCPTQVLVNVFLNGEYVGVYGLGEHLEEGVGRVEVRHDMTQRDCGYFLEAGGVVSGVDVKGMNYFHAGLVKFVLIKGPEYNLLTSEQFAFIDEYMRAADLAVKNGAGYEEYLDLESLVDWMIMTELSNNTDCAWRRSTYFTKNPGEKLVMGPVWDFDLAFGNFSKDVAGFDTWVSTSEDDYVGVTWSTYLLEDPEFQALFKKRWEEKRSELLEIATEEIWENYHLLSRSADENFQRWQILGKKVAFERFDTKDYPTYFSQMVYLENFLIDRAAWIDSQVEAW